MPTVTLTAEADVSTISSGEGAGVGDHLPVGYWSGYHFKSAVRFPLPAGWTAWSSITSAILNITTSDFYHVGVRSSGIYIRRQAVASLWTKGQGSSNCDSSFSSSNTTGYSDLAASTAGQVSLTSGTTANSKKSPNVTALTEYYRTNGASKIVFVIDAQDSNDYTEFWSRDTTKDATLVITYVDQSPPNAPTLVSPAAGATVVSTAPTFNWTHNDPQGDAQNFADIELADNAGTVLDTRTIAGFGTTTIWPTTLVRGTTYKWRVRTSDAVSGYGAWSAQQSFTIAAPVVATITAKRLVWNNGAPRVQIDFTWTPPTDGTGRTMQSYRVYWTGGAGYDSGVIAGVAAQHTATAFVVGDNVALTAMRVDVTDTSNIVGTGATTTFTPRYGQTVQRGDMGSAPINWGTPAVDADVPASTALIIEYGSSATATAAPSPNVWYSSLGAVPLARYVFYRATLLPVPGGAKPTLRSITIPANFTVTLLDDWLLWGGGAFAAPWYVDTGEYVYGTRSVAVNADGTLRRLQSQPIALRAGRSYILTGLMKSQGNSGASIAMYDTTGVIVTGGGYSLPVGPVQTEVLVATRDWYTPDQVDVYRYRTPVFRAPADMTVYAVVQVTGAGGTKAWFDAVKVEESSVATPWSPSAIGAVVIDAGGVQVDAQKGGILRGKGSLGAARDTVELGPHGWLFGSDSDLYSPSAGALSVNGVAILRAGDVIAGPGAGTAFPGSPATNTRFFRTDLGMEFYYNGTRWLSMQLFEALLAATHRLTFPLTGSLGSAGRWPVNLKGGSDLWIVDYQADFVVGTGSALSASHKWVLTVYSRTLNTATDNSVGAVTSVDSGAVNIERLAIVPVGALLQAGTAQAIIAHTWTMTGTPGNLYASVAVNYRVVAT